jgi:hypothetical protein
MDLQGFQTWTSETSIIAMVFLLFVAMCVAAAIGDVFRRRLGHAPTETAEASDGQEGYIVSAVLGLLALLMGFTFSLAVDRFDARRRLVLEEANAIGTAYLRSQLLEEPHRARMSGIFTRYVDNRLALSNARPGSPEMTRRLATNDALVTDIWAGAAAAFDSIKGLDFSSAYIDSINAVIDLDTSRKIARVTRVPTEVIAVLLIYLVFTAGVLGYVLKGRRGRLSAAFLMGLLTLSLVLIIDINRPANGGVTESQLPMELLKKSLAAQPPATFDKWKTPAATSGQAGQHP